MSWLKHVGSRISLPNLLVVVVSWLIIIVGLQCIQHDKLQWGEFFIWLSWIISTPTLVKRK